MIASDVRDFEFAAASGAPEEAARLYTGVFLQGVAAPARPFDRWHARESARLAQIAKWCHDAARPKRDSSLTLLAPGAQIGHGGRYRIERELGTGGASTVFLAYDSRHERQVAIKVLREDISETISPERFEKEIRIVAQLQHPHILPLFDSGELGTVLYSVMPYVPGETVRQRLDRSSRLPVDEALRIATEVADALAYAHEHGVLHRDVKPENILLSDGHALIADFGIARAIASHHEVRTTLPGVVLGTAAYMSPEQATGDPLLDGRTDVYAMGAVLYEMLTGAPPFAGEHPRRMMTRRLTEVPPPVSTLGVRAPEKLELAIAGALQPHQDKRITSREFADMLASARKRITTEEMRVPDPTPAQPMRASSTTPSRRTIVIGTALAALAAALLISQCAAAQQPPPSPLPDTSLLSRLLLAEDSRAPHAIATLMEGLRAPDQLLRKVAIRALGRLQRPNLAATLGESLDDPSPLLRAEAANALAQSVQGLPRGSAANDSIRNLVRGVNAQLVRRLSRETDRAVFGVIARSLGRLPFADSAAARSVERTIAEELTRVASTAGTLQPLGAGPAHDVAHGLYALSLARRTLGDPSRAAITLLRSAATFRAGNAAESAARVRRVGMLALSAAGALDTTTTIAASQDPDPQVRRLAIAGFGALGATSRAALVRRVLADTAAMVRVDAVRAARLGSTSPDCALIIASTRDPNPHVMLAAIDALAGNCADNAARTQLLRSLTAASDWHPRAHALVSLARADSAAAVQLLSHFSTAEPPQLRAYAATAATQLRDAGTLYRLAGDANHNVREAAVAGLAKVRGHAADSVYIAALESPGYQVVLAAAGALAGSPHAAAVAALLDALDRLTAEHRENSRDPRIAVLTRVAELGAPIDAPRLERYLTDFDTTIAARASEVLSKWSGRAATPHPVPLPIRAEPLAETFMARGLQLRITMGGPAGGTFVVRLFPDEAPATVARIVRLARSGYYNGLTFHRIATNFVIQGGSPDATEYMGDAAFMRDEVGLRSHDRGTLGISTRGRDTGDAQLFVNLVDNPRLDHDYTVFGEVVSGLQVIDRVIEGAVIARVEVVGGR